MSEPDKYLRELKWLAPAAKTRAGEMIAAGERSASRPGEEAPEGELDAFLFAVGRSRGLAFLVVDAVSRALDAAADLAPAKPDGAMETDRARTYAERIAILVAKARDAERLSRIGQAIREVRQEYAGCWRSCSGCYETNEGYPAAPSDPDLGVPLGGGCSECGGVGAIWDTTDYEAMGTALAVELNGDDR